MSVATELKALYMKHGGLKPEVVVDWAEAHPNSALHKRFQWDDTKAAREYRLWQARQIIVQVEVEYPDKKIRQVYVSPIQNRWGEDARGYVPLVEVLSREETRRMYLEQAVSEYERLGDKYTDLKELSEVFASVKRARKAIKTKPKKVRRKAA